VAPRLRLAAIRVTRPRQPFRLEPPQPLRFDFGPIALLGYGLERGTATAGETVALSFYWRGQARMSQALLARVALAGADGQPAVTLDVEPANGYPTSQWQPGDEWLGQHALRLPAALPAGTYPIEVSLPGASGERVVLTNLRVSAPERRFEPLPFEATSGASFEGVGVLEGYSLTRGDGELRVALAWRATGSPAVSDTAFIHLSDAAGRVWAQSDAVPAGWTRPTTGWLAGEWIRDEHVLSLPADLPAGEYTLWAGLYDALTGQRVPASGPGAAPDQRVALGVVAWP
jgi:hypothetical protein